MSSYCGCTVFNLNSPLILSFFDNLMGKSLDVLVSLVRIQSGEFSDSIHQSCVFPLLTLQTSHLTDLRDQVNWFVIIFVGHHKKGLTIIFDSDGIVLLIVLKEGHVGSFNF